MSRSKRNYYRVRGRRLLRAGALPRSVAGRLCAGHVSGSERQLPSGGVRSGIPPHPDAKRRSGAYGSGLEDGLAESQDPVSLEVSPVHGQRHGRPRAGRSGDRTRSTDDCGQPVQHVFEGRHARL